MMLTHQSVLSLCLLYAWLYETKHVPRRTRTLNKSILAVFAARVPTPRETERVGEVEIHVSRTQLNFRPTSESLAQNTKRSEA